MHYLIRVLIVLSLFLSCSSDDKITIFLIGDSTMSDKNDPGNNPEYGWGQVLPQFFNEHVTIRNFAVNGRSTRSFIDEGRWQSVLSEIKNGDFVFIQFGHNDQKDKDPLRYTNPLTAYRRNLEKFVSETRYHGGRPVLLTSIVRRKFNDYGVLVDTHGLYPLVVRQVAREMQVPFIDLQYKSELLVSSLGPEQSKKLYLWLDPGEYEMYTDGRQDDTHFNKQGAVRMAALAIEGLKENNSVLVHFLKSSNNN